MPRQCNWLSSVWCLHIAISLTNRLSEMMCMLVTRNIPTEVLCAREEKARERERQSKRKYIIYIYIYVCIKHSRQNMPPRHTEEMNMYASSLIVFHAFALLIDRVCVQQVIQLCETGFNQSNLDRRANSLN